MKYILPLLVASAAAFPGMNVDSIAANESPFDSLSRRDLHDVAAIAKRATEEAMVERDGMLVDRDTGIPYDTPLSTFSAIESNCGPKPCAPFSATEQFVSTTGQHAYASPAADEIRGPCPGLNAAANHGYLPRSGVASIQETIVGLGQAFGMSIDLAAFLAAYAVVFDGDLVTQTWSIGGPSNQVGAGGGLLGAPQGISYSHNKYEGDTSIGRGDAYINNGDAHSLQVDRFAQAFSVGLSDDRYTLDRFRQNFLVNVKKSIAENPYYFTGLFSTTLVAPAAYNFVINFMSNHSAEEPNGYLNGEMFKQFFAVEGDYPNFKWLPGQERFPENWYRRPSVSAYNAVNVIEDLAIGWAAYPGTFRFGGNTNGVNTYAGIDLTNISGGVYNLKNILEPANFACFFFQFEQQVIPDFLKPTINDIAGGLSLVNKYSSPLISGLTCPALAPYDSSIFNQYPGHSYSPTGPGTNY